MTRIVYKQFLKRGFDIACAGAVLVLMLPFMFVIGIVLLLSQGRPVLFRQSRPGRHEVAFQLLKFRTMQEPDGDSPVILDDDQRLTTFGRWLRRYSLDELPSLVNVLVGEMSLVGPRPLLMQYLPWYTTEERRRFEVRPGITGLAQVSGRNTLSWDERFLLDIKYVEEMGLFLDLKILLQTFTQVLVGKNVAVDTLTIEPYLDEVRSKQLDLSTVDMPENRKASVNDSASEPA